MSYTVSGWVSVKASADCNRSWCEAGVACMFTMNSYHTYFLLIGLQEWKKQNKTKQKNETQNKNNHHNHK